MHILAGDLAELTQCFGKVLVLRIHHGIGPIGGDDAPAPAAGADGRMMVEWIERTLGGGDHLDVEAREEGAWPEARGLQRGSDRVVIEVGSAGVEPYAQREDIMEDMIQPHCGGRAAKQVEVPCEKPPCLAWINRGP